jgi:signal recognition particle subunit SRP54
MFESLTSKLERTFKQLRNRGKLTEADIDAALEDIRMALLEADVNFEVTKDFCQGVKDKALGMKVLKQLNPGQMIIKFVHEELNREMGEHAPLNLRHAPPVIIMLVGLQGSGKTTSAAKLARHLRASLKRSPLLVSVDVYRPAAIEQLKTLGETLDVEVFASSATQDPVAIAQSAVEYARNSGLDTLIIDTAGRLQIDNELMDELAKIVQSVDPHEILLVADAMTGQEAVHVARGFDARLDLDGLILSKLDGDARGGAALSMRAVTGKPIKFIGIGEKLDALEPFHPDRMASRILGMGDVLTLIEKASQEVSVEDAKKLQKKLKKNEFSLEDFHSQLQNIKKMGSMGSLLQMVPGMGKAMQGFDEEAGERELRHIEAMILSMTPAERKDYTIINGSRRKRIARGSGTSVEDINRMLQQFTGMRKMMKNLTKLGPAGLRGMGGMGNLASMLGTSKMPRGR